MKKFLFNFVKNVHFQNYFVIASILLLQTDIARCSNVSFNRTKTGVLFTPPYDNETHWTKYSLEDVKTMLEVVSTKFSRVITYGGVVNRDPLVSTTYKANETYYYSNSHVFAPVAAATINWYRNLTDPIRMYVGAYMYANTTQVDLEMNLTRESIEKANEISKGTVEGIVFAYNYSSDDSKFSRFALREMQELVDESSGWKGKLKVGFRHNCVDNLENEDIRNNLRKIIELSDFVICEVYPDSSKNESNVQITDELINSFRQNLQSLSALDEDFEIMVQTGVAARSENQTEVAAMQKFWEDRNANSSVNLWLDQAFDCPWKVSIGFGAQHRGWWELKNDTVFNRLEAYTEKVQDPVPQPPTQVINTSTAQPGNNTVTTPTPRTFNGTATVKPTKPGVTVTTTRNSGATGLHPFHTVLVILGTIIISWLL